MSRSLTQWTWSGSAAPCWTQIGLSHAEPRSPARPCTCYARVGDITLFGIGRQAFIRATAAPFAAYVISQQKDQASPRADSLIKGPSTKQPRQSGSRRISHELCGFAERIIEVHSGIRGIEAVTVRPLLIGTFIDLGGSVPRLHKRHIGSANSLYLLAEPLIPFRLGLRLVDDLTSRSRHAGELRETANKLFRNIRKSWWER